MKVDELTETDKWRLGTKPDKFSHKCDISLAAIDSSHAEDAPHLLISVHRNAGCSAVLHAPQRLTSRFAKGRNGFSRHVHQQASPVKSVDPEFFFPSRFAGEHGCFLRAGFG